MLHLQFPSASLLTLVPSQQMPTVESVLNQSIDAINVVGRVALAVGTAIDNAIEVLPAQHSSPCDRCSIVPTCQHAILLHLQSVR